MSRTATSRKTEQPFEYSASFAEFLGCRIDLSLRPFIPRPETEFWVERAIEEIIQKTHNCAVFVLDMFAGSGCVGVAVLKHIPNAHVVFAEKEKKFLEQIKKNLVLNTIPPSRYQLVQSDVFSKVTGKFDYIFANPPYLATTRKRFIQKSVLNWEPHAALFAGADGLSVIRKFLSGAKKFLNPGGQMYMEFDSFQKPRIAKILRSLNFCSFEFFKDQYKKWRCVVVRATEKGNNV